MAPPFHVYSYTAYLYACSRNENKTNLASTARLLQFRNDDLFNAEILALVADVLICKLQCALHIYVYIL